MAIFVIGPKEAEAIKAAHARARASPIPWKTLRRYANPRLKAKREIKLADRGPDFSRPPSEQVLIPTGFVLNISYEEQPPGLLLHLSISSPTSDRTVPLPETLLMVLETLNIDKGLATHHWLEEFVDGGTIGRALNLVVLVEPKKKPGPMVVETKQ